MANILTIFERTFGLRDRCKGVHCVDFGESFPTHIYLQNLASIQPRTSPFKFARSPRAQIPQVFVGDTLDYATGHTYRALLHRVQIQMQDAGRLSMPFFLRADRDTVPWAANVR